MKSLVATLGLLASTAFAQEFKSLRFDLEQVSLREEKLKELHLKASGEELDDDPEEDDLGPRNTKLELVKEDYRYQAPVYFGSAKNKAMMSFDTGSSYTVVTSDLCPKKDCPSQSYKPGTSKTTFNLNMRYQLEIDQGGNPVKMNVFSFVDSVCLSEEKDSDYCLNDFQFYAISKQRGLSQRQDGIVGIAPVQTNKHSDEGPSFVNELKKAGVIDRAVVGLFVSRFSSKTHSIQIGDYDTGLVHGGEPHLHWFNLAVPEKVGLWRWQTDLTDSYLGDHTIFQHSFKWVEVNAAYAKVGFTSEDFEKASARLMDVDESIVCDLDTCSGKNECDAYTGKLPSVTFTLSNRVNATIPGDELLTKETDEESEFKCKILLANSGDYYLMGEPFLRYYYSVYDLEYNKMALGRVIDFDAPPEEALDPDSDTVPEGHSSRDDDQDFIRNASIFAGIVVVFFACACCLQKRNARHDASQSGSSAARKARKQLRLTEDNPNRSLIEGQMENGQFDFVGGDGEDDEEDVVGEGQTEEDENLPRSALASEDA